MILDFTDKNNVRRIIDTKQISYALFNPSFEGKPRVVFYFLGGGSLNFTPPNDWDMDLILASIVNQMKGRNQ